jgi:hypothetical protein
MEIPEANLAAICKYRRYRFKKDSHAELEDYCGLPIYRPGYEPECKFQCCEMEVDDETN